MGDLVGKEPNEESAVIRDRVKSSVALWVYQDKEFCSLFVSDIVRSWAPF